ncbi:hypothetical protein M3181_04245 [Mesobacillus maritimus]|uniref:hypothetical protein n=1 Tax=Mesobacillus maritimus TaxID=1643336 RepID=UPI00203DC0B5|nr:hypothetical protein [Mesobacillus maritimus]MCM3668212.1 hypothetical protein [Mesobacillus maritimus]
MVFQHSGNLQGIWNERRSGVIFSKLIEKVLIEGIKTKIYSEMEDILKMILSRIVFLAYHLVNMR